MRYPSILLKAIVGYTVFCSYSLPAYAGPDSVSLEVSGGVHVQSVRAGVQWEWANKWWQSNGTHLGGYWDLSLAQWRGGRYQNTLGATQNLTDIGLTPVFRFQRDNKLGAYGEFGIGVHYLSDLYDNNNRQLSTHLQFGDLIGVGYVFSNKFDLGLRLQHFSNGGIKEPNSGVNFVVIRSSYRF